MLWGRERAEQIECVWLSYISLCYHGEENNVMGGVCRAVSEEEVLLLTCHVL